MTLEEIVQAFRDEFGRDHVELCQTDADYERQIYIRSGKDKTGRSPATIVVTLKRFSGEKWRVSHAGISQPLYAVLRLVDDEYSRERGARLL